MSIDYSNFAFPKNKPIEKKITTEMRKKSKKLAKKERNRFSILQQDRYKCFACEMTFEYKLEQHEAFGGSNRTKSMDFGLVYYLCTPCHNQADVDENLKNRLHKFAKAVFIKKYNKEKFLKEFGKNYIKNTTTKARQNN